MRGPCRRQRGVGQGGGKVRGEETVQEWDGDYCRDEGDVQRRESSGFRVENLRRL